MQWSPPLEPRCSCFSYSRFSINQKQMAIGSSSVWWTEYFLQVFENYNLQRWWSTESDATGSTSSYLEGSQNMEFLGSLVEIGKMIWTPITKWLGYSNNIDENMQSLKRKIDDLSNQEDDINAELMNAELRLRKRRKKKVDVWLKEVHKIKGDLQKIEQEVVEGRNYISRARLGKLVVEKLQEVVELKEKGKFSDGLLVNALPSIWQIPTAPMGRGVTVERNMGTIWESLTNDEVQKIGVFGMGGVGKTTIMHHINNQLMGMTSKFDNVIWITFSKAFSVARLQNEIAASVNLDLSDYKDETRRASKLYAMLIQMKRYVLILDDLWEAFPLEKVGLPEPTRINGCKLVLTTRSLKVCTKMECRPIKVELLSEEEALDLFMSKVSPQFVLPLEVLEIAELIARKCAGLPLAIVTVAGSMKGVEDIHEWRYASREIANWTEGINDMENEVFERLKFSYSRLKDETLKRCFLYCALYPEDHKIPRQELIGYWIAEGLITDRIGEQAATDKGHTILNKLENTCLLECYTNRSGEKWVKVHDVIREMALNITKVSPRFMVQAGVGLTESLTEDWSEDLERVSLMYNRIESLSFSPPRCQKLSTLLLQRNPLIGISNSFFYHMQSLRVLDLSYTRIESLPESISLLANLRELSLDHCVDLSHVPSLEKLKALRKLKLGYTKILEFPPGMEELINLKILDLYHTHRLEMLLRGKLAHLSQLKCLRIDRSNIKVWAEELLSLRELQILGASFHDLQEFNNYVKSQQWQELTNYRLLLGDDADVESYTIGKEVWVINRHLMSEGGDFLMVPSNILDFKLIRCHDIRSLTEISSLQNARDLKTCYVEYCVGIESIFYSLSSQEEQHYIPKSLENLILSDLPYLRVVFRGIVPPYCTHSNLKKLIIYHCANLRYLFSSNLSSHLENLEFLSVNDCEQLESIITEETGNRNIMGCSSAKITFPKLKDLELMYLPELKSIYNGFMLCKSLRCITVLNCPVLKMLSLALHTENGQTSAPAALKQIIGQEKWWESLEWDEADAKATLQSLFYNVKNKCNLVKSIMIIDYRSLLHSVSQA